jgi:hypothetical protein
MIICFNAGKVIPDYTFELMERDASNNIITKTYEETWLIVDNGYLKWSTTVPPFKLSASEKERR